MSKYLDLAGLTAYDTKLKEWINAGVVDITEDNILDLFPGILEDNSIEYQMIDLGLPSGLKWSDRNVGAETPQDYGLYFSWANVDGHGVDENGNTADGYPFDNDRYYITPGRQYTGSTLDAEHDAATANMGKEWRMPTRTETNELIKNTDHYYIIGEGDNRIIAGPFDYTTNASNKGLNTTTTGPMKKYSICFVKKGEEFNYNARGNFIEFPFSGNCYESSLINKSSFGVVWTSSADFTKIATVYNLRFYTNGELKGSDWLDYSNRFVGYPVRGVCEIHEPIVNGSWVTFTAEEANSTIGLTKLSTNQTLQYSTDTTTWNTFDTTTNISLNNGDKVYVRGVLSGDNTGSNYTQFTMTGKISASGNCNAIWNYQDLNAPLKARCGYWMFKECSSLITAPELPSTELAYYCYGKMFMNCTSLTTAPVLSTMKLANSCYDGMFYGCTSLTTAPELPATTLDGFCYKGMFSGCTSLTTAPELPATTLEEGCYSTMFSGCTSLTTAPELPATMLTRDCYYYMFQNCTSLNHIMCLATNLIIGSQSTGNWVKGVASTGTFIKHPDMNDWSTGDYGIPSGWTVVDAEL